MFSSWTNTDELDDFGKELLSSNIAGAKTLEKLFDIERDITFAKITKLRQNPIRGNYDYSHLKAIHKELFKDIYVWAGMDIVLDIEGYFVKVVQNLRMEKNCTSSL